MVALNPKFDVAGVLWDSFRDSVTLSVAPGLRA